MGLIPGLKELEHATTLSTKKQEGRARWADIADPGYQFRVKEGAPQPEPLSEQEKEIIARMKELAMGDPELDNLYKEFTVHAMEGKAGMPPSLERDIREREAIEKEEIARGLGSTGDVASTPGIKRMGTFRENVMRAKEAARRSAIAKGEELMTSAASRRLTAAHTALGAKAKERGLMSEADRQRWVNESARTAGLVQLGTQVGGAVEAYGGRRKKAGVIKEEI